MFTTRTVNALAMVITAGFLSSCVLPIQAGTEVLAV